MLNSQLEDFIHLLKEEIKLYRGLVSILRREKQDIIELSLEKLNETLKEKETCILKLRILEERRSASLEEISKILNCPSGCLTIPELIRHVNGRYCHDLRNCHTDLKNLAEKISHINSENGKFIEHSLACTNSSLSLLRYLGTSNPIYLPSGQVKKGNSKFTGGLSQKI